MIDPQPVTGRETVVPFELDAFVIRLEGEFDIAERARLLDAFAVSTTSATVVIDFNKARYVDSTVLECLVALQRALAERGARPLLIELSPEIRRIFDVCGLDRLFSIRKTLDEVMADLNADATRMRTLTLIAQPTDAVEGNGATTDDATQARRRERDRPLVADR